MSFVRNNLPPITPPQIVVNTGSGGGAVSPLTTKGDLYGFGTGNNRIPVGADGFLLEADSTQALGIGYSTRDANLNNNNIINTAGVLIGNSTFPTIAASPGSLTTLVQPILSTDGTYTVNQSAVPASTFFAPVLLNDTITVSGANGFECAAMGTRTYMKFNDGFANETGTAWDCGAQFSGSNTLADIFGVGMGLFVDINCTNYWGISHYLSTLGSSTNTITSASLFRGATLIQGSSTVGTLIGLDLTNLNIPNSRVTTMWGVATGSAPSYFLGTLLLNSTTVPTTAQGGATLFTAPELASNGTFTLSGATGANEDYIPWLLNDSITVSGASGSGLTIYPLAIYPTVTFSDGLTGEQIAGLNVSPKLLGSNTLATAYGLQLNANIGGSLSVTSAYGTSSVLIWNSSGTCSTLNVFYGQTLKLAGAVTTLIGLNLTNLSASGATIWGMQVGNYQSYHLGPLQIGGSSAPYIALDIQGSGAKASGIGLVRNTVSPTTPATSNSAYFQWHGGTSGHDYFIIAYNDGGTVRYTAIGPLDTTTVPSLTKGTSLPT